MGPCRVESEALPHPSCRRAIAGHVAGDTLTDTGSWPPCFGRGDGIVAGIAWPIYAARTRDARSSPGSGPAWLAARMARTFPAFTTFAASPSRAAWQWGPAHRGSCSGHQLTSRSEVTRTPNRIRCSPGRGTSAVSRCMAARTPAATSPDAWCPERAGLVRVPVVDGHGGRALLRRPIRAAERARRSRRCGGAATTSFTT